MRKTILFKLLILAIIPLLNTGTVGLGQTSTDSTGTSVPTPYELTDINYEIEQTQKKLNKMQYQLDPDETVIKIDSALKKYVVFLNKQASEFHEYNPNNLSKFFLENTYRSWEGFNSKLFDWHKDINDRIVAIQKNIDELDKLKTRWDLTSSSDEVMGELIDLDSRMTKVIVDIKDIRYRFLQKKRDLLQIEDKVSEMTTFNNSIIEEVSQLQQHLRDGLFIPVAGPLWRVKVDRSDFSPVKPRLKKVWYENSKTMLNYLKTINLGPFLISIFFIILLFIILRVKYLKLEKDDSDPGYKSILRTIIDHPVLTLFSIILITYHLLFPYYPLIIAQILTLILLINMRYILAGFIRNEDKVLITRLIILLILNDAEIVFWYFGNVARYYILIESFIGLALIYKYVPRNKWAGFKALNNNKKAIGLLAGISFLFYFLSLIANIFGFLDLSVLLMKAGIHVPEFTVILFGVSKISKAVVKAFVQIGIAGNYKAIENYWGIIEKRSFQIINLLVYFYWVLFLLIAFEVSRPVIDWLAEFFMKDRAIGTLNITLGGIFLFIIILGVTFTITSFIKVFVESEILNRLKLRKGIPATISVTIRYFLIVLGVTFALSSAGIELGKVSLLAGALGIGIGFGLQNIVVNFISGLILVYERPLQVGDTIEVENLLGQVKQIGARSSHVRTYDGAEVVVPNGNLISNQLINWTLSDNRRRIEIKVGVSYGSDPNLILKLLEKVANENEDIQKDPAPRALFEDFGDSSLNFRLLFWIPYEIGIGTKSDVAIGIFNIFKENNVEIPFPQVDLHVKKDAID